MQHLRFFHSKSFTLLQQNQSTFTTILLPFYNKQKALSQQIFYPFPDFITFLRHHIAQIENQ